MIFPLALRIFFLRDMEFSGTHSEAVPPDCSALEACQNSAEAAAALCLAAEEV